MLHRLITRNALLLTDRNGIDIGGVGTIGQSHPGASSPFNHPLDQKVGPVGSFIFDHRLERIQPLPGLLGIFIHLLCHHSGLSNALSCLSLATIEPSPRNKRRNGTGR